MYTTLVVAVASSAVPVNDAPTTNELHDAPELTLATRSLRLTQLLSLATSVYEMRGSSDMPLLLPSE
jgi:hypothetical protein